LSYSFPRISTPSKMEEADYRQRIWRSTEELILETELNEAARLRLRSYFCPYRDCHGGKRVATGGIKQHLAKVDHDPFLMRSMVGGDPVSGYPEFGAWVLPDFVYRDSVDDAEPDDVFFECPDRLPSPLIDQHHDIHEMFMDAMRRADELHGDSSITGNADSGEDCDIDNDEDEYMAGLEELYASVSHPVYRGSPVSMISAIVVLLTMCSTHGVNNTFVDELLTYLYTNLLPEGNSLPSEHYSAKTIVKKLGLSYTVIHACPDGHVLFRGQFENMDRCPTCDKSQWMPGSGTIPQKVIRHFPLIPRLRKMYRSPMISEMLKWHYTNVSTNGEMASIVDSPAWKHIESIDPSFIAERRNVRMALSLDGMNPFSMQRTNHSTWPILVMLYNLPP
jgi:hypothetical protein